MEELNGYNNGINGNHIPKTKENKTNKCLIDIIKTGKKCIWNKRVEGTELEKFRHRVNERYNLNLEDYWDLHKWSVDNYEDFWKETWHYFGVKYSKLYEKVLNPGPCFSDVEWFPGARLNYAENMLRYRDDHVALIHVNERDEEVKVTYAELYQEVRLYAAALRNKGLKKGDCVACYISNRIETVFIMLAVASIGAQFGGPLPFYGAKAASNIMKMTRPKFVFAVDEFIDEEKEYNLLKNLPVMVNDMESIEKVIIVPSRQDSLRKDISGVKNSCFLKDFLDSGRDNNGDVPELLFEQLPFNHPLFFGFTSGTTGLPKGLIHGAGNFLPLLRDHKIQNSFGRNDVILTTLPLGWNLWNIYICYLMIGCTILFYEGCPYFKSKNYFWNIISTYKVSHTFLVTSVVDRMEKERIRPSSNCNLENLRLISIGGSPVKLQNMQFMTNILPNHVCVANMYGATEFLGLLGFFDYNLPMYSGEIQAASLGTHIMCFDERGNHVVGQRGELVIAKPSPAMPIDFFIEKEQIKSVYFDVYPGTWTQHDEIWIDPDTRGFVVLGRSDETLNPGGERFGSSEVYNAIHRMEELADYLCVGQSNANGDERAVLFIKLNKSYEFTKDLVHRIKNQIGSELTQECIPEIILQVKDIPYNLNKKRMEKLVKTIINTNNVPDVPNCRNPECLKFYCNLQALEGY